MNFTCIFSYVFTFSALSHLHKYLIILPSYLNSFQEIKRITLNNNYIISSLNILITDMLNSGINYIKNFFLFDKGIFNRILYFK